MGFFWLGRGWLRHLSAMKRASGVFQPSRLTFVGETRQKRCIADCEQHKNWMNVEQTIFAPEVISPCFSSGSTDSLFQALSKWERVKRKQNKQLQAGTRFSLRSFSLNGSLEQTFKRPHPRPFFPRRTARRESTLDRWDLLYKFTKRCLWNLTHVYYFSRETLFIGN